MLQNSVEIFARELFKLLPMAAKWPGHQSAALLSWMFNVGSGVPITILDVANLLINELGRELQPEIVNKFRAGDIRHCILPHLEST